MTLGTHAATIGLFREADGTYRITVASADRKVFAQPEPGEVLHDVVVRAITEAAKRLKRDMRRREGPTPAQIEHMCRLAYRAGYKAALAGKPPEANNRPPGTVMHDAWYDGWAAAWNEARP